jgi:pyrroline-5-carboxylate reductase
VTTVGILGTGHIAAALVTGWRTGGTGPGRIVLSPRNADNAAALARRFAGVEVAADNQAVLDAASIVILGVRPQLAEAVLASLRFTAEHRVLSLIAALDIGRLSHQIAPARYPVRAVPMPFVADRNGPLALYPGADWAMALLAPLGDVIAAADEAAFNRFCGITATMSAYCATLAAMSAWLVAGGVSAAEADRYLASYARAMGLALPTSPPLDLAALVPRFATRGGINEFFADALTAAGGFDLFTRGLDRVLDRIEGRAALPSDAQ